MRRIFIVTIVILFSINGFSQVRLGLKVSPNLSWNRVIAPSTLDVSGNGAKFRFGGGAFVDFMFSDNYALNAGIAYTTKGAGIKSPLDSTNAQIVTPFSLQYLEIPISLKLFTNEIGTDMKLYFQIGGNINTNLAAKVGEDGDKVDADGRNYSKDFTFLDLSTLVSAGLEMQMGENTSVFGGFTYNRGLLNANANKNLETQKIEFYNEYVSLDIGLKF